MTEIVDRKINLLIREVEQKTKNDRYLRENFRRIEEFFNQLSSDTTKVNTVINNISNSGGVTAEFAAKLRVNRQCTEGILFGELVKADSATHVSLATQNGSVSDAQVLGLALEDGAVGATINILLLGVAENAAFSIFNVNDPLFLDIDGGISNVPPTTGKKLIIGKSLGGNQILVQIGEITVLA